MKKLTLLIALACLSIGLQARINATYLVAPQLKSSSDIVADDLRNYDFIYLFSAVPAWVAEDFDLSQEEINKKYVDDFNYPNPELIEEFISTVHKVGGKVLCSFQGTEFINIASSEERSSKFARMMALFAQKYDYDGIELDWEHTITEELHLNFMQKIRAELTALSGGNRRYWLTTALHSYRNYTKEQAEQLCQCTDWINIMFYDMGGGVWGTVATHNCPLDQMKEAFTQQWKYFPAEKLHVGLASYGFYYKGIKPGEEVPEGKTLKDFGRYCQYTELPGRLADGWTEVWDDKAQCAYFVSPDGNEFMTLETERSMDAKLSWLKAAGFGGVFWWEYSYDRIKPTKVGERGKHLITDYVTKAIKN